MPAGLVPKFKILKRCALAAAAVLVSAGGLELALHLFPPQAFDIALNHERLLTPDDLLGAALRPNLDLTLESEGGGTYRAVTNSLGLRERPFDGKDGKKIILGLGDSFLFGEGVEREESLLGRIQAEFENKSPGRVRIINAGVPGYSTNQEAVYYMARGEDLFRPDLVLLFYYINDVVLGYNPQHPKLWTDIPLPDPLEEDPGRWYDLRRTRIAKFWHFWRSTQGGNTGDALDAPTAVMPGEALMFNRVTFPQQKHRVYDKLGFLCRRLKEHAESRGSRLIMVYVPAAVEAEDGVGREKYYRNYAYHPSRWDWETPNRTVEEVARILGIRFINLLPAFRKHWDETRQSLYFNGYGHFNPEGHKLAAEVLLPELMTDLQLDNPARP